MYCIVYRHDNIGTRHPIDRSILDKSTPLIGCSTRDIKHRSADSGEEDSDGSSERNHAFVKAVTDVVKKLQRESDKNRKGVVDSATFESFQARIEDEGKAGRQGCAKCGSSRIRQSRDRGGGSWYSRIWVFVPQVLRDGCQHFTPDKSPLACTPPTCGHMKGVKIGMKCVWSWLQVIRVDCAAQGII